MNTHTTPNAVPPRAARSRVAGFTLVELLVVLAICASLLTSAIPAFTGMIDSIRLSGMANEFVGQLTLARGEAIARNGRVVLCKSADKLSCAATGTWDQGWIMFSDTNNNALRDEGEPLMLAAAATMASYAFKGGSTVASYVSYAPNGSARQAGGGLQMGTFTLCRRGAGQMQAREIIINSVGRARIEKTTATCA